MSVLRNAARRNDRIHINITMSTTIQIPTKLRKRLKDERLPHESNYGETIERLLGESGGQLWTEQEIRDMAKSVVRDEIQTHPH